MRNPCPNCKYQFRRFGANCKFKCELGHRENEMARDSRGRNFRRVFGESRERVRQGGRTRKRVSAQVYLVLARKRNAYSTLAYRDLPIEISQTSLALAIKTITIVTRERNWKISSFPVVPPINALLLSIAKVQATGSVETSRCAKSLLYGYFIPS